MSINAKLQAHIDARRLYEFVPPYPVPGAVLKRRVLMVEAVHHACAGNGPRKTQLRGATLGNVNAVFADLVTGQETDETDVKDLKGDHAAGVWEVRVTEKPHVRFFGFFVMKDVIVITNWKMREDLGRGHEQPWADVIEAVLTCRASRFADLPILIGREREDHITDVF